MPRLADAPRLATHAPRSAAHDSQSDPAQDGYDLACDPRLAARNRGVGRVLGHQPHATIYLSVRLDRALEFGPFDDRGHDVPVLGRLESANTPLTR